MERLVKRKINIHLESNNLIGDSQHDFRNKHSCLTSLLDFFDTVNKAVDLVYLNFQKAFYKVSHERLLVKIMAHGIKGSAAEWSWNWLAGWCQRFGIK